VEKCGEVDSGPRNGNGRAAVKQLESHYLYSQASDSRATEAFSSSGLERRELMSCNRASTALKLVSLSLSLSLSLSVSLSLSLFFQSYEAGFD
jgi:hypothetical protein